LPEFDFTLNIADANLYKLNFDKLDTTSSVTMLLTANFKGNSIDNLDGEIKLLNSNFVKYGHNLELYDFSIRRCFPCGQAHRREFKADPLCDQFGSCLSSYGIMEFVLHKSVKLSCQVAVFVITSRL